MGTSVSHGSPRTTHWKAVQTMYQDARFPVERVLREVWRASGDLQEQLKDERIGRILEVALTHNKPSEVSFAVAREISKLGQPSLALELAKRAAIQSTGAQDRIGAFTQQIFAEASNYVVSRDLPGNVGLGSRITDIAKSVQFKTDIVQQTVTTVKTVIDAREPTSVQWGKLAHRIVKKLSEQD